MLECIPGIISISGRVYHKDKRVVAPCIHPASVGYNRKKNQPLFQKSISNFANVIGNYAQESSLKNALVINSN